MLAFQLWLVEVDARFITCGYASVPIIFILAIQAWAGFRAYYRQIEVDQFAEKRRALADTPENRLAESLRGMHPTTVQMFFKNRMEKWRIKETDIEELVDWVLDADPRIHVRFLEHVLNHSTGWAIMAKRTLVDKSYSFDSTRVVTDYEQYDALIMLLQRRGMLTEGYGNEPGQWIEPWLPELIARKFGIEVEKDEEQTSAVSG
jgi:hypothetical protein